MFGSKTKVPMPWDIMVFVTITAVGFGVSVQQFMNRDAKTEATSQASVAASDVRGRRASRVNDTVDLGCLDRITTRRIQAEVGKLRLKGRVCSPSFISSLRVSNHTTGRDGTVFIRDRARTFVTDNLVMKSGKNVIHLDWVDGTENSWRVTTEVTIP